MTGEYENPSADKFGPPPGEERFEAPKALRARSLSTILVFILYFAVRGFVPHIHGRGWLAVAGLALAGAVGAVDALVFRKLRDRLRENDQVSSSEHITP